MQSSRQGWRPLATHHQPTLALVGNQSHPRETEDRFGRAEDGTGTADPASVALGPVAWICVGPTNRRMQCRSHVGEASAPNDAVRFADMPLRSPASSRPTPRPASNDSGRRPSTCSNLYSDQGGAWGGLDSIAVHGAIRRPCRLRTIHGPSPCGDWLYIAPTFA